MTATEAAAYLDMNPRTLVAWARKKTMYPRMD